ncbi:hypothetical protein P7K49_012234 [Saguinus oedipus]|uniref:Uncharacterized protein n=1 Tax=Saguinus oedipus TaxID=9490 RepID=A0ABQ9VSY2_SAGOE|nr:hypothetical protein P7K49_012234 [Saguinus oedipus]
MTGARSVEGVRRRTLTLHPFPATAELQLKGGAFHAMNHLLPPQTHSETPAVQGPESTQQAHVNGAGTHRWEAVAEEQTQLQEGALPHAARKLHHPTESAQSRTQAPREPHPAQPNPGKPRT